MSMRQVYEVCVTGNVFPYVPMFQSILTIVFVNYRRFRLTHCKVELPREYLSKGDG